MRYERLCEEIICDVGGRENVRCVCHCMTRLRFELEDRALVRDEELQALDGVIKIVDAGGQLQVVIGPHVDGVYRELVEIGGFDEEAPLEVDESDAPAESEAEGKGAVSRFLIMISGIITPVLSILMVSGMIKAFLQLALLLGWLVADSGTYVVLYAIGDALFYYFPIALGWSAAKRFGLKEIIGMTVGACLVYPSIVSLGTGTPLYSVLSGTPFASDVYAEFLGLPILLPAQTYANSVIPVIVMVWVASRFYRLLERKVPDAIKFFVAPFLTLVVIVPLSLLVIGPITMALQDLIATAFAMLVRLSPAVAGLLIGGLWTILVVFGLHMALIAMFTVNIAQFGFDVINPMLYPGSFALLGAALGVAVRAGSARERSSSIPSLIAQVFGVSEPLLYAVLFPRKKLTIATFAAAGIGGAIAAAFGAKLYAFGTGIISLPCYIGPDGVDAGFIALCAGSLVAFAISFAAGLRFAESKEADVTVSL